MSRPTEEEIARGALRHSHGEVAVSITGFDGGGAPDDQPGLVHFAWGRRDGEIATREEHSGNVGRARIPALRTALAMLADALD